MWSEGRMGDGGWGDRERKRGADGRCEACQARLSRPYSF